MTEINVNTGTMNRANIDAGGDLLAEDSPDVALTNSPTATQLRIRDQVGSLRGLWDLGSNWVGAFPYGDGATAGDGSVSGDNPPGTLFAAKRRDQETRNDYFGARYYNSHVGRFNSPDPSQHTYADMSDTQDLNLYSYSRNNPVTLTDPTGLAIQLVCTGDSTETSETQIDPYGREGRVVVKATLPKCEALDDGRGNASSGFGGFAEHSFVDVSLGTLFGWIPGLHNFLDPGC